MILKYQTNFCLKELHISHLLKAWWGIFTAATWSYTLTLLNVIIRFLNLIPFYSSKQESIISLPDTLSEMETGFLIMNRLTQNITDERRASTILWSNKPRVLFKKSTTLLLILYDYSISIDMWSLLHLCQSIDISHYPSIMLTSCTCSLFQF